MLAELDKLWARDRKAADSAVAGYIRWLSTAAGDEPEWSPRTNDIACAMGMPSEEATDGGADALLEEWVAAEEGTGGDLSRPGGRALFGAGIGLAVSQALFGLLFLVAAGTGTAQMTTLLASAGVSMCAIGVLWTELVARHLDPARRPYPQWVALFFPLIPILWLSLASWTMQRPTTAPGRWARHVVTLAAGLCLAVGSASVSWNLIGQPVWVPYPPSMVAAVLAAMACGAGSIWVAGTSDALVRGFIEPADEEH